MKVPAPCAACAWGREPDLHPENEEAWVLWSEVLTQWRSGGLSIIGLDYACLYQAAARLGIELSVRTMKKIKALEQSVLAALAR